MNAYIQEVLEKVEKRDKNEPEFLQTVEEVLKSLETVIDQHPEYQKAGLLERLVEPERVIEFRVPWVDDAGKVNVNRGFRVQFNSAIGPYKGGLRFASHVNLSVMKFLGFEQTFKNSLTSLPMGGGKGGSDFDPNGKSDAEIMRFCQSFMTELQRHIGPNVDVPAGDIGVGGREIGYLFGQYKRIRGAYENGVLTGKAPSFGGSPFRPEATGFGAVYYLCEVLKHENDTIYDPDGVVTEEKINYMLDMRNSGRNKVQDYADKFGVQFFPGQKPWGQKVDVCMPCAYQNEIGMKEAEQMIANGLKYYIEVANMPTTNEALYFLMDKGLIVAPSKAVNAGGVAVSGLEMSQNSERLTWKPEEVDEKLHHIMVNIHAASEKAAAEAGLGYNLVAGANIAGFKKVADAMMAQGIV